MFFADSVTGAEAEMKLDLTDHNRYDMRIFLKSFPLPDSVEVCAWDSGMVQCWACQWKNLSPKNPGNARVPL